MTIAAMHALAERERKRHASVWGFRDEDLNEKGDHNQVKGRRTRKAIIDALREHGPMTPQQTADLTGMTRDQVYGQFRRMHAANVLQRRDERVQGRNWMQCFYSLPEGK